MTKALHMESYSLMVNARTHAWANFCKVLQGYRGPLDAILECMCCLKAKGFETRIFSIRVDLFFQCFR